MEMIKLRTGYEAVKPVVIATKIAIESLYEERDRWTHRYL